MRTGVLVRSAGYVGLCVTLIAAFLAVASGAFVDASLQGTRDPDWIFWIGACCLVTLICRAPFVGVVVRGDRVTRRSWLRSRSWGRAEVVAVSTVNYSGYLNRYSRSRRFVMLALTMQDGSTVDVPEISGAASTVNRLAAHLTEAVMPPDSDSGSHHT